MERYAKKEDDDQERRLTLKEIAQAQNALYEYRRSSVVFVMMFFHTQEEADRVKRLFGGIVTMLVSPGSWHGDIRSPANKARGNYQWDAQDEEAYLFCREILPYLDEYDTYRAEFCRRLIKKYENNPNK